MHWNYDDLVKASRNIDCYSYHRRHRLEFYVEEKYDGKEYETDRSKIAEAEEIGLRPRKDLHNNAQSD